ncbi:oxysterol-binding protein-related protein 8 isoform X2 [Helicoverpa zea]|uniref:oxysterol-binding protein-related protein 8 isoform X2 n=1 Tax=Helicoverpa zea TaxID=7113 RepID=UPI001F5A36CC|nr:oxysterol-binding protein-related protein 8 isoform X2 [Helicoverpa zea]
MSSSPAVEPSSPSTSPSSPALRADCAQFQTSTPYYTGRQPQPPLNVVLPATAPATPPTYGEATLTPPPRSPGVPTVASPASASGDGRSHPPDGTSSDKSSETAVGGISRTASTALSRKESYKAQRQHYRREKKRAASALLHSIEDPSVVVLADWLKVRGSLKSWTKLWCVLKPGLLLLYKSPKAKSSHWVGTVLLTSCQVIERPSKKDGFCFKLYHPLEQSIWAPRGPHNETIGAVVQPLPTAHLIFRAPSQAAGHCWLDGLELALRCSNAMLRCSRSRPEQTVAADSPATQTNLSHEDLEKHFNEHELAGAASDSDSEASRIGMPNRPDKKQEILAEIEASYVADTNFDIGVAGLIEEEVAEENKSLLWFLLKQVRPGMDLSKVVLPTFILEPRSFLDKLSDNYYHADILAQAQQIVDPYQRFVAVVRWYLSGLYRKPKGLKKPYNPVLGETFRCCWRHSQDSYTYYVAEQVSHHPPVSAFYVTNRKEGFVIEGSLLAKSKFYGNSTSAILEGCARIHLLNWGETYITTAPYAHCKGIVIGTLSMELGGKVHVMCPDTGYQADVEFKLRSFLGGADQTNSIQGRIKRGKETVAVLEGYWDGKIDIKDKKTGEESNLFDVSVLKEQRLPRYLMSMEKQQDFESAKLWIKVSEAIQNEDQIAATEQKTIIEEAQRGRARNLVTPWIPRLFHRNPHAAPPDGVTDQGWVYNHLNTTPWQADEIIEYEEDFVIKTLREGPPPVKTSVELRRDLARRMSDSDSHDELARPKSSARTLKQSLYAIDTALREQTLAIERLSKSVETISEAQRQAASNRPLNVGRVPTSSHSWDLFGGFVLAMVLQALLNWVFYQKD